MKILLKTVAILENNSRGPENGPAQNGKDKQTAASQQTATAPASSALSIRLCNSHSSTLLAHWLTHPFSSFKTSHCLSNKCIHSPLLWKLIMYISQTVFPQNLQSQNIDSQSHLASQNHHYLSHSSPE